MASEQTVRMGIPQDYHELQEVAYNLWWSWSPEARNLFSAIDRQHWATYRNPVELLMGVDPHRWEQLVDDEAFLNNYRRVIRAYNAYMDPDAETPFRRLRPDHAGGVVAYFSTEFGLHESLRIYCGGLGVLSGDHAKAASDFGLPFVGVSILYRIGYFHQRIDPDGRQQHVYDKADFERLPIRPVFDATGQPLLVTVDFPGREVAARVWELSAGRVKLYLLDTDIPQNDPSDRPITSQLYVRGREMRLCQELILGVGGVRALRAMKIAPEVWHINEGHSAFQIVERIRCGLRNGRSWEQAGQHVRESSVFTTHTPVPAGNESFDHALAERYLAPYAEAMDIDLRRLTALGDAYPEGSHQPFNLTAFAARFSRFANGVSRLHGTVASDMWRHLWPENSAESQPVKYVTNGIHSSTWLGYGMRQLFEERLGSDWQDRLLEPDFWRGIEKLSDEELWETHLGQKDRMIRKIRVLMVAQAARHGCSPDEIRAVSRMMNPHALTIGFARRFATYKRANLIFRDMERLRRILKDPDRPVQIVFAGKAHPADTAGQELVRGIVDIAARSDLRGHVFMVEDYDIQIGRLLAQGVDVWLNTPWRPREASGTSGQKAALNGALNLSVADGWWAEASNPELGWSIGDERQAVNEDMQDYHDASCLYELLEEEVVPKFYDAGSLGYPADWVAMMKKSMAALIPQYSAARMLVDYIEQAYFPAGEASD